MAWQKWIIITWVAILWLPTSFVGANPVSAVDTEALVVKVQQQIKTFGEKSPQTLATMLDIASACDAHGDYKGAIPWAEKAVKVSSELFGENSQNTGVCIGLVAAEYRKLGRYSEALPLAEKILQIHREAYGEKHLDTLTSLVIVAQDYRAVGRYDEVISLSQRTLEIGGELLGLNHKLTLMIGRGLAGDYRRVGRYSEAMALDEKVLLNSIETLGERHLDTIVSYSNLATDYRRIGRFDDALEMDQTGLKLAKEVLGEKNLETLNLMSNLAADYRKLERYNDAIEVDKRVLKEKLEILGEGNASTLVSMNNMASDYFAIGRYSEAAELHKKALVLSCQVLGDKHPDTLATQNNLALDYNRLGRYAEAVKLEETLLKSKTEVLGEGHPDTLNSVNNLASNYYTQGRFDDSAVLLQKLINGIEELRGESDLSTENRQTLFAQWIPAYKNLALLQAERNQPAAAFYLSELTKARTLLELTANHFADNSGILAEEEAQQLEAYQKEVNQLNDRIVNSIDKADERIRLEGIKRDVLNQLNEYREELQKKYPKYQKLSEVQIASAQAAQHSVPPQAVFISYVQTNDSKVVAFVIDHSGRLKAIPLGIISGLDDRVEVYRELLSYRDINHMRSSNRYLWKLTEGYKMTGSMVKPAENATLVKGNTQMSGVVAEMAKELGNDLLSPIAREIQGKEQLIISPDGSLTLIPFETLTFGDKPLIASYDISYVQSLSMLTALQQRAEMQSKAINRKGLLAMGDAYYQIGKNNLPNGSMIRTRSGAFQDLPLSEPELDALAGLFGQQGDIYKKDEATEARLKELNTSEALEKYKYIVFSAHGYFDDKEPAFNSIVLGLKNPVPGTDGYVTVTKWPAFDLNSDLVYMSACETGRGKFVPGEGILGLTYALYVAGNRNSIATLWKILDDESSVEFTRSFFAKLLAGEDQVKALSATKREFMNSKYAKPIYWAPFVLYGI